MFEEIVKSMIPFCLWLTVDGNEADAAPRVASATATMAVCAFVVAVISMRLSGIE
jgi:hypothetical protein